MRINRGLFYFAVPLNIAIFAYAMYLHHFAG